MVSITAATPSERLAAFQSRHLIAPHLISPATLDDPILGGQVVCEVDGIRVHPIRNGWRHDTAETTRLFSEVNGGSWPRASVAAVAADVAREDAFVNGRLTFERVIGNQTFAIDVDLD